MDTQYGTCLHAPWNIRWATEMDGHWARKLKAQLKRAPIKRGRGTLGLHRDGEACVAHARSAWEDAPLARWRSLKRFNKQAVRKGWEPLVPDLKNAKGTYCQSLVPDAALEDDVLYPDVGAREFASSALNRVLMDMGSFSATDRRRIWHHYYQYAVLPHDELETLGLIKGRASVRHVRDMETLGLHYELQDAAGLTA